MEERGFRALFLVTIAAGAVAIMVLKPRIAGDSHALGLHVVAMFIPYACCAAVLIYLLLVDRLTGPRLLAVAIMYLALAAGFWDLFFEPITHYPNDDPDRHSRYAHQIVEQQTLFGWDSLRWGDVRHYVDQPGFRYYLAGLFVLLGGEHRLLQLTNMLVFLAVLLVFWHECRSRLDRRRFFWMGLFFALSLPYAAKNIIQGLSEWLAVALVLSYGIFFLRRQYIAAIVLVALAPFVRQNLLPVSILLFVFTAYSGRKPWLAAPYLLVLLLPVYHNLYYAGELRLLVENKGALLSLQGDVWDLMARLGGVLGWKALTYAGYAGDVDVLTLVLGALFVPLGTGLMVWTLWAAEGRARLLLLTVVILTLGPAVLFGSAYYPRFVFLNQYVVLATALLMGGRGMLPWARQQTPAG